MANTIIYAEDWAVKLQERLSEMNKWKRICKVEYTDTKTLNNPYMTDAAVQSGTRGSAYTHQDIVETNETIAIDTFKILAQLIDRADLAQSIYSKQMELADRQGILLNEAIETAMFAEHAQWTNVGDSSGTIASGVTTAITVSATNIDDIIRGIKRIIRVASGEELMNRNGIFIAWRPADFELLEAFVQANGFSTADGALKDGTNQGFKYMGVEHYSSNKITAGHLFAGVIGVFHLGICKSTYGQVVINQEPAISGGSVSGIGIVSRVDFKFKAWATVTPVLFDINVA